MREAIDEIKMEAAKKPVLFLIEVAFLVALIGTGFLSNTYDPFAVWMFYAIVGINTTTMLLFGESEIDFFLPRTEKQFIQIKWKKTVLQAILYTSALTISYGSMLAVMWKKNACQIGGKELFLLVVVIVFSFLQYMILKIGVIVEVYHPADTVHVGEAGFGKELRGELLQKIYFFLSIFFMGDVVLVDGPEVERFKTVLSKFPILLRPQGGNGLLVQVLVFLVLTVLLLLDLKRQCVELGIGEYKAE